MSDETHVAAHRHGAVLHLVLDRPAKKNALTRAMYAALADALTDAVTDASVRAVVLSGRDGVFTGGNDLGDFMMDPPTGPDSPVFRFLKALVGFPKPILAAVAGPAIGIGTTALLHCDLAYAAPDAVFKMPFVDLGLVPEAASSVLLPRLAGQVRAAELLLFGERFSAETAYEVGLLNAVVDDPEAVALERAAVLAAKPPAAVRMTKALLRHDTADVVGDAIAREGALFVERLGSPEAAEAFSAFFEKRAPDFSAFD
ncbi:enoyl-CoA hydratase [Rubrivirga sp. IMCC43871]|uniref:enoyl-CoA hydratase n=1 Tax=Rubrivirga sp. IMCC43871 TaxID=3391575 RepID=UPI00398FCDF5